MSEPRRAARVCVAGTAGRTDVHFHTYVERLTTATIVLRRRPGAPHLFTRRAPHSGVPAAVWGPVTLATACQRPGTARQ